MRMQLKLTIYILITAFPCSAFARLGQDTARDMTDILPPPDSGHLFSRWLH